MFKLNISALGVCAVLFTTSPRVHGEHIVIMHTNDTHSQIDPATDGKGGVARRKVLIDSIRAAEPHTLLIDAGDAVQGSNYFTLYGGEVEALMLNELGYEYAILGNHEFDNGMESLGKYISSVNAPYIATNYIVTGTPLEGKLTRYRIVPIAGKRIGLIGINIDPKGMIADEKSVGVVYQDPFKAANATAWHLKNNEGVDYVVAITHIGYEVNPLPDDIKLVANSENIDIIIGGHSHTVVEPGSEKSHRKNAAGKDVLIAQTGSTGANLGVITIDTDNNTFSSQLIPVDSRLDGRVDDSILAKLEPYRHGVDSLKSIVVGKSRIEAPRGDERILNFVTDFIEWEGKRLNDNKAVDLGIANRGGIRTPMNSGPITRGGIMEMLPFDNRVVVLELTGQQLLDVFDTNVKAPRVGFSRPVAVVVENGHVTRATLNGVAVDPEKTYVVSTVDYLANGGDYMTPLTLGKVLNSSDRIMNLDVIDYIGSLKGKTVKENKTRRFSAADN